MASLEKVLINGLEETEHMAIYDVYSTTDSLSALPCFLCVCAVDEDGMDCMDNERRPHFPQFSYSASGRE